MVEMIEVRGVSKSFGSQQVLKDVDFQVKAGEIVGLLGPNGAGKTTVIRILNGVIKADAGTISIMGLSPTQSDDIRAISGIVTESAGLYHQMSGLENLEFFAELYGVEDNAQIKRLLELFELVDHQHKPVGTYSTGMKKRLALSKALLHNPKILFLDEPTNGLDPDGIKMVLSYLKTYNQQTGTTIILCSHVLHQLEPICDSFAFLENKTIVEQGSKQELEQKYLTEIVVSVSTDYVPQEKTFLGFRCEKFENGMTITLPSKEEISTILKELLKHHRVYSVEIANNDLESIYFKVREKINR
ncbi:ABC-2 type transport system ATP-binding protein [Mesobacillus persicus]|uniref:ABC-2 type transport system ATP-binding protein n=2 Tax=Mesobacillus persicus TaxID=930146 RepID=A0A1H7WBZ4_9BACI|nr:ABC-2 type transport system ATP-binding protein [Mesobacillus persicus]